MTIATTLREAARIMERDGYSHESFGRAGSGCFLTAIGNAEGSRETRQCATDYFERTIFGGDNLWFDSINLERMGWNQRDAVAALNVAADIAEAKSV